MAKAKMLDVWQHYDKAAHDGFLAESSAIRADWSALWSGIPLALRESIASLDSGVPSSKLAPETPEAAPQVLPSADKTKEDMPVDMKTTLPSVNLVNSSAIVEPPSKGIIGTKEGNVNAPG